MSDDLAFEERERLSYESVKTKEFFRLIKNDEFEKVKLALNNDCALAYVKDPF